MGHQYPQHFALSWASITSPPTRVAFSRGIVVSILMCVPVAWIHSEKLAEVVRALVAERCFECWALVDAVSKRAITTMKLDDKLIVEIVDFFEVREVERNYLIASEALHFFSAHAHHPKAARMKMMASMSVRPRSDRPRSKAEESGSYFMSEP